MISMNIMKMIETCHRCDSLGIDYHKERKENRELAYKYKPDVVKYLWIVESPPFSDPPRYFYRPELTRYDSLYREVMKALNIVPANPKDSSLLKFKDMGHFLIDSAKCPVDKEHSLLKSKIMQNCAELLQMEVRSLNPKNIFIIKSSIHAKVLATLEGIDFESKVLNNRPIPFPGSGQQVRFRNTISDFLNTDKVLFNSPNKPILIKTKGNILPMDSIIVSNITVKDVKAKKIRITVDNKHSTYKHQN